jgi:hypothetical protein
LGVSGAPFWRVCSAGPDQPLLQIRLIGGLLILKHMHNLSDEALCDLDAFSRLSIVCGLNWNPQYDRSLSYFGRRSSLDAAGYLHLLCII